MATAGRIAEFVFECKTVLYIAMAQFQYLL